LDPDHIRIITDAQFTGNFSTTTATAIMTTTTITASIATTTTTSATPATVQISHASLAFFSSLLLLLLSLP
jgi:hypothetical protein